MLIEEVIRRNRRRIVLVTIAASVNYGIVVTLGSWLVVWGLVHRVTDRTWPLSLQASTSVVIGAVAATVIIRGRVRTMRPRVVADVGAVDARGGERPVLTNLLDELAIAVGTPPVRAAVLADPAPNALAVGSRPDDTTIVVTTGLIESLTRDELEAVLAVELWAVRRLDTALQTVTVACTASTVAVHHDMRSDWKDPRIWPMVVVTWPFMAVAELLRRSVLRSADFGADEMAVATTRHPEALRRALEKLAGDARVVGALDVRTAPLWFEPIPHDDPQRAREFRRLALTPDLCERLKRLPPVA